MIITRTEQAPQVQYAYLNVFPDQFKTDEEKRQKSYIKNTLDYFANVAFSQYKRNKETFTKNYDLRKGIIDYADFYKTSPGTQSFVETLLNKEELPDYVKHYSIINPPFNTMLGELGKRPDIHRIRAFDDDSKSAEMEFRTEKLQDFYLQQERMNMYRRLQASGQIDQIPEEEIEQLTLEKVKEEIINYTSTAEIWGNDILRALKARFVMKEKSEDAFGDLLTTNREFFHVYEDNSKIGFGVEVANPKNVWQLGTPDVKYTSGASGRQDTAYAAGLVNVMEISEIIEKFPELTMEEINHLRKIQQDLALLGRSSFDTKGVGSDTIKYDTYDPLLEQERLLIESEIRENKDDLKDWLGLSSNATTFGYKFTVVRSYHLSKKKVGELTYDDGEGNIISTMVDESYKEGSPGEIDIKWGWVNQWYKGLRIGSEIYHLSPFNLLDYCPIIGLINEIKNTESRSLIDLMKPYQILFNVCMNQLWERLEKDWGMVYRVQLRRIPTPKDGDPQDAIQVWEEEARSRGVVFEDDSPENLKTQLSNTTTSGVMDLSRHNEIQVRYNLAVQLMQLCWSLVGVNEQRLGASQATDTATAIQTNLTQSYTQTEPYFAAHEYVMDQVYQAMVDAAQHVESKKPMSTISFITSEGVNAFNSVTSSDIKLKDLWVINVSSPNDQQLFGEIRGLSQAMLQNGASPYEIIELYSTESIRKMKDIFKDLKDKQDAILAQQQQLEQQKLQIAQETAENQLAEEARQKEIDRINENYNKEQDRLSKERIAIITATGFGKVEGEDTNANALPDVLEASRLSNEIVVSQKDFEIKMREFDHKERELKTKRDLELEKLKVERENMKNDEKIARINAKNKPKPTAKPKAKKK